MGRASCSCLNEKAPGSVAVSPGGDGRDIAATGMAWFALGLLDDALCGGTVVSGPLVLVAAASSAHPFFTAKSGFFAAVGGVLAKSGADPIAKGATCDN